MRDKDTPTSQFKDALHTLTLCIAFEALKDHLTLKETKIVTPITKTIGHKLDKVVIIPILRAGLGMSEALQDILPNAIHGHFGIYRDHETKKPKEYLFKMPKTKDHLFIVVDPMLATGNTAVYAINKMRKYGIKTANIIILTIVTAPEGIENFTTKYPKIPIYTATLDQKLNADCYIVPGLGDAGDRLFGTTE